MSETLQEVQMEGGALPLSTSNSTTNIRLGEKEEEEPGFQRIGRSKPAVNFILGCLAEWAHLPITLPLDCWTTQIQTGNNGNKGPLAILLHMLSHGDGIKGMYKGIQAYTILCLKPAIHNTRFLNKSRPYSWPENIMIRHLATLLSRHQRHSSSE